MEKSKGYDNMIGYAVGSLSQHLMEYVVMTTYYNNK